VRHPQNETPVSWAWNYRDEDHPRPAEIAPLEAFLNTVDHHRFGAHADKPDDQRDLLSTPEAVARWLVDQDLLAPSVVVTTADAVLVRQVRDELRRSLRRDDLGAGGSLHEAHLLAALPLEVALADHGLQLVPVHDGVRGALERLLALAVTAEAKGTLTRLKVCAAPDCRFVYYDRSRSRTSRWCAMETCGNRVKTRQYRQRRA
jgi:predicted RNA-binding Zn ribbon-like protein